MVAALHAGLGVLLDEGISEVQERHAACGKELQAGLEALGLELLVEPAHRLPQLTTVKVPAAADDAGCRGRLLSDYGIEIGAGAGQLAGQIWRIGCMGNTARRRNVVTLVAALREVLAR
jgi:alanine-glyoxylate transaminase/serine-glyoxylate transaminase/serine-pyruvate transaminase